MKRFVKKIVLLSVLLLIIMAALNRLGIEGGGIYKDGAALVCEAKRRMVRSGALQHKENKAAVWFMGNSRILAGLVPLHFDKLSGDRTFSYNLALPALPISSSYFVLEDYLEKNPPPQYIVMQLYINHGRTGTVGNYYAAQGMSGWHEMFSLFKNRDNKSILLNYIFPFRMYWSHTCRYLYNRIFHPPAVRRLQKNNRAVLNRVAAGRGYYFIEEQAVSGDNRLPEELVRKRGGGFKKGGVYDPFIDPYVEKFFALTLENGIKVMLIQPVYRRGQFLQYVKNPPQFTALLERYKHVAMAKGGWKLKFYDNHFFSDLVHLNKDGALRFTGEIYKEFNEVFPAGALPGAKLL